MDLLQLETEYATQALHVCTKCLNRLFDKFLFHAIPYREKETHKNR